MFEKLFNNAGSKLRIVANITFVLYVIAGAMVGCLFAFIEDDVIIMLPVGIASGFVVGWLSTLMFHVIADISENLSSINRKMSSITENQEN